MIYFEVINSYINQLNDLLKKVYMYSKDPHETFYRVMMERGEAFYKNFMYECGSI